LDDNEFQQRRANLDERIEAAREATEAAAAKKAWWLPDIERLVDAGDGSNETLEKLLLVRQWLVEALCGAIVQPQGAATMDAIVAATRIDRLAAERGYPGGAVSDGP